VTLVKITVGCAPRGVKKNRFCQSWDVAGDACALYVAGDAYTLTIWGDTYALAIRGNAYTLAIWGNAYTLAIWGDTYTLAIWGDTYALAVWGNAYTLALDIWGYTCAIWGDAHTLWVTAGDDIAIDAPNRQGKRDGGGRQAEKGADSELNGSTHWQLKQDLKWKKGPI